MTRDEAITRLRRHQADLMRLGVAHLYLFGSVARNEAGDGSDVDVFFDHERGRLGIFDLMNVKERTAAILGCEADVMTRASLHPALKARIEASAIAVY